METAAQPGHAQAVADAKEGATSAQLGPAEAVASASGNGLAAQPGLAETAAGVHGMGTAVQAKTEGLLCHDPASGSAEDGNPAAPDAAQDAWPAETLPPIPVPGAVEQPAFGAQEADLLQRCPHYAGSLSQRPSSAASWGKADGKQLQVVQAAGKAPNAPEVAGLHIGRQSPAPRVAWLQVGLWVSFLQRFSAPACQLCCSVRGCWLCCCAWLCRPSGCLDG